MRAARTFLAEVLAIREMARRAFRKELSHKEHEEHKDCKGRIHAVNQASFHHFPLVIFVLFVADLFLPDLYQSAISPCRSLVAAEAAPGLSWFRLSLRDICDSKSAATGVPRPKK